MLSLVASICVSQFANAPCNDGPVDVGQLGVMSAAPSNRYMFCKESVFYKKLHMTPGLQLADGSILI